MKGQFEIPGRDHAGQLVGPREFGITMILIGLGLLVTASCEYRRDRKGLRKLYCEMPRSTSGVFAALIAALGILALFAALFRQ